jgi:hypothetical protein
VWLDPSRATDVPDLTAILVKLDQGETVELSTGFPVRSVEEAPGVHNGRAYDRVIRPAGFDHLAVFAGKTGACSVTDGCGLGVNHAADCELVPVVAESAATDLPEPPPAEIAAKVPAWWVFLERAAKFLGFSRSTNESDEDRREQLRTALIDKFGGRDVFLWITAVYSDDGYLVYEREAKSDAGLFRVDYEISEDGAVALSEPVEVRRITTFQPVANDAGDSTPEEGSTMNRQEMIAHLAGAGRDTEVLNKLSDCDLKALMGVAKPAADNAAPSDPDERTWQEKALTYKRQLEEERASTEHARNEEARKRHDMLEDLLYKGRAVAWNEGELKAMGFEQLSKVHAQVFATKPDYSGQGGPRPIGSVNAGGFDWVRPMSQVLSEKEAN